MLLPLSNKLKIMKISMAMMVRTKKVNGMMQRVEMGMMKLIKIMSKVMTRSMRRSICSIHEF
jgi:hypothetical protein